MSTTVWGTWLHASVVLMGFACGDGADDERHDPTPLIPRKALFGNPDRVSPQVSPDGSRLAYLAPLDGVMNVFVTPLGHPAQARPVTHDRNRGIQFFLWAPTNQHILYSSDQNGDENFHIYCTDLTTQIARDLTPGMGLRAEVEQYSHKFPEEVLVGINDRNPQFHDLYRINVVTGAKSLVIQNDGYLGFVTDDEYQVRLASRFTADGDIEVLELDRDRPPEVFMKIPMADTLTTGVIAFDKTGKTVYATDSRGRNTAALVAIDGATGRRRILAENPLADVGSVMMHPTEKTIEAVSLNYLRNEWTALDPSVRADFEALRRLDAGDFSIANRSLDNRKWIVAFAHDDGPTRFFVWDRDQKKGTFLFSNRAVLEELPLAKMHPVIVPARDGQKLVSYLTLPRSSQAEGTPPRPQKPLPMVLHVHGGPWSRDTWGFNPIHQLWANRGYAVLSVNFRGSTGYGKAFLNAANREWGGKMHDDLIDAVQWAVHEKIADPAKVGIMGGSYGGYATLAGLTLSPDVFACGVDIVGPSNLVTLLESVPPYWKPAIQMFKTRVGDHMTPEGRAFLAKRSPLTYADRISRPLLIGQGANDPRVKQAESDRIVQAMIKKNIPVTYVLFPDEGHGFVRPENRLAFFAVSDVFLAMHLGGRFEPLSGQDFQGSSILVPNGVDGIPGLQGTLPGGKE